MQFFVTIVYGFNTPGERKTLWKDLRALAANSEKPWCLLGDFNEVLSTSEIDGGNDSWDNGMQDFLDCFEDISVVDLRAAGPVVELSGC